MPARGLLRSPPAPVPASPSPPPSPVTCVTLPFPAGNTPNGDAHLGRRRHAAPSYMRACVYIAGRSALFAALVIVLLSGFFVGKIVFPENPVLVRDVPGSAVYMSYCEVVWKTKNKKNILIRLG